jgi:hypothetical protein
MASSLLGVVFPAKIAFPSEDLPVLVESPGAWQYRHFGNWSRKIQYLVPAGAPLRWVNRAGRGAAATSSEWGCDLVAVRHGVPMTVGRVPAFCHATAISLS